jgi:hypothetical protein
MSDCNGNLSVDFLVGFTIFMIAFIWVATLVPNLFLGVATHEIDFDAVAYRTSVILAEDPGESVDKDIPWEFQQLPSGKDNIERLGLALSKDTPNILSIDKINRFFDEPASFTYPDDYRARVIFGDYPYRFNISLQPAGESPRFVGDIRPENYGSARREVKIKHASSNATFDLTDKNKFNLTNRDTKSSFPGQILDGNVSFHKFTIEINNTQLLSENVTSPVTDPNATFPNYRAAYQINPRYDWINITMTDFDKTGVNSYQGSWPGVTYDVNLTDIRFEYITDFTGKDGKPPARFDLAPAAGVPHTNYLFVDGELQPGKLSDNVNNFTHVQTRQNVTFSFPPRFFYSSTDWGAIYITLTFQARGFTPENSGEWKGMQYLNTTSVPPWRYNYNTTEVTQPYLTDGVLEVAVW